MWDTVYAVNCRGTFLMTQRAARVMIDQGRGGRIINFSSGVSSRGSAGAAAYASSRAATESFTRVAAIELAPYEILVNCVSPGLIDTQPKPLPPAMAESLGRRIPQLPLARPGEPEEVASLVLWLCSSGSSYVTGSICPRRRRDRGGQPGRGADHRRRRALRLGYRPAASVVRSGRSLKRVPAASFTAIRRGRTGRAGAGGTSRGSGWIFGESRQVVGT